MLDLLRKAAFNAVLMYPEGEAPAGGGSGEGTPASGTPSSEGTPPAEKPAGEGTPTGETPAGEGTPPAGEGKPSTPAGKDEAARRFSELSARTREAERVAREAQERERLALEALARVGQAPPAKKEGESEPEEPSAPEWNGDPAEYQKAMAQYARDLASYSASKAAKAAIAEEAATRARASQADNAKRVQTEWSKRRAEAIRTMPDYEVVAENPELTITEAMAGAITTDVEGPAIAYALGQNPAEAARIAALPPGHQLMEIGALKARLIAERAARKTTQTPPPPKPLKGGSSQGTPLAELPMDDYAAKRNEQLAANRKPGVR